MKTDLAPEYQDTPDGIAADAIVRKCVHCGFCNATCPTYQLLGNELDGPRGRIYLIKQVLEGADVTRATQQHLDRCLTCRNCETTCPSGVEYGRLAEIGRRLVDDKVERPLGERVARWALKEGLTSPLFGPAVALGHALRPVLPAVLADKLRPHQQGSVAPAAVMLRPTGSSEPLARRVLVLEGCVQPALAPNINAATTRVLAAAGIQTVAVRSAGCCGAIRLHLNDHDGALGHMRRNIDAWWPSIEAGSVEAILINASGCAVTVKDYGKALAGDPAYAVKAARVAALARDLSEVLADLVPLLRGKLRMGQEGRLAFHPPCTLQHGQRITGRVEPALAALGFEVRVASDEAHLCCGSAGTYSVLQPELSRQLRDRKLERLAAQHPDCIVSANIGCIQHLQGGTTTPVRHWVEVLAVALA
jgi:glycolate oxidase iron-sulfur subunit